MDMKNGKEIYRLCISFLRKKVEFKETIARFEQEKIFQQLLPIISIEQLKSNEDVLKHNAAINAADEALKRVFESYPARDKERAAIYLMYYLFFLNIFAEPYSYDDWWQWQTQGGQYSPPNLATYLLSQWVWWWFNGKPTRRGDVFSPDRDGNFGTYDVPETVPHQFYTPAYLRKRVPEIKVYLQVYELRKEQGLKWREVMEAVEPLWLKRKINETRNIERTYYTYLRKAQNIIRNIESGRLLDIRSPTTP